MSGPCSASDPLKGIISGLGLLDIWIGISEAVNYRDTPKSKPNH